MNDAETTGREATSGALDAYQAHRRDLVRFAAVLAGPDDAADVVSAAIMRILERDPGSLGAPCAYLYRSVANQARNLRRGEARRRDREERAAEPEKVEIQPEPYPEVREAIRRLSVRQRAVVYLTDWEDMAEGDVASHLGIGRG